MFNLLMAIITSTLVSVLIRLSEPRGRNTMVMFLANYAVCALISLFYLGGQAPIPTGEGALFTIGLGIVGGILYLVSFAMLQLNIRKNGVVLSGIFMKLGVLIPMVMAILFFHEIPGITQVLGFLIAIAAILMINMEPGSKAVSGSSALLLLLLLVGGLTDSFANIYDKVGSPALKDHYLFFIFLSAGVLCLITALVQHKPLCSADVLFGVLLGIPNYFSSRFLLLSLSDVPAIVVYPVYNVGTIVALTLFGVLVFRERLSRRKQLGIGLILVALVLLNL